MTAEKCVTYIDHVFKVVPVCILMRGSAKGDVPGKLFNERISRDQEARVLHTFRAG